jgi:hypothetical protein
VFVLDGKRTVAKGDTHRTRDAAVAKARRKARSTANQLSTVVGKKSRRRAKLKKLLHQHKLASFRHTEAHSNQLVAGFGEDRHPGWTAVIADGEADVWISKQSKERMVMNKSTAIVTTDSDLLVREGTTTLIIPETRGLQVRSWNMIEKAKVFTMCTIQVLIRIIINN